ncbi:hypothetical protein, partial [Streptobacillus moniliformis]|uniref:hypothetical protein n=1 Tax=Streptobacillus moniliformis TaxID=34105 RepID=UPI001E49A12F
LPKFVAAPAADVENPPAPREGSAGAAAEQNKAPVSEAPKPAAEPSPPAEARGKSIAKSSVDAQRDSDGLRVTFSFPGATPAALYRRADT